MTACQEDGNELTLDDLTKDDVAETKRYKLRATVEVFPFNTNIVQAKTFPRKIEFTAINGNDYIKINIPTVETGVPVIGVGTYYGGSSELVSMLYKGPDNRIYNNPISRFPSDLVINVTEVDSIRRTFNGTFSATLYNDVNVNPADKKNQVSVSNGQLINVSY